MLRTFLSRQPLTYTNKTTFALILTEPRYDGKRVPKGKKNYYKGEIKMKKVVYSIQKLGRFDTPKITGLGFLADKDLVIACLSQKGKPYIRVFGDALDSCHPIIGKAGEYKGQYFEYREIDVDKDNNGYTTTNTIEVEVEYKIWFKYTD